MIHGAFSDARALTAKHKAAPAAGRWRKAQSASGNATSVCVTSASSQLSVRTAFTGDRGAGTGKASGIPIDAMCSAIVEYYDREERNGE
jgi:hypothetical protein